MTARTARARMPSSAGWYRKSGARCSAAAPPVEGADRSGGVRAELTGHDQRGHFVHLGPPVHRLRLEEPPCFLFVLPITVHQDALGPIDDLASLQALGEVAHLALEAGLLRVPPEGDLDRGDEVALLERLDDVAHRAGVAGLLDEVALRERGEDEDGGEPLPRDVSGGRQTVHARHLDVEDREVGTEVADELDGLVAASGLADDLVALLLEELLQVEADDGLVLGDHDPGGLVTGSRHGDPQLVSSAAMRSSRSSCSRSSAEMDRTSASRWRARAAACLRASRASASPSGVSATRARRRASSASSSRNASCSSVTASSARCRLRRSLTSVRRRSMSFVPTAAFYGSASAGTGRDTPQWAP